MLIVGLIFMSTSMMAQDFGVRAGLNLSNVGPNGDNCHIKAGFNLGGVMDIQIGRTDWYIQPGLYFTLKGLTWHDDGASYNKRKNFGYIELPVVGSYKFELGRKMALRLDAGPYFAFGVIANYKDVRYQDHYKRTIKLFETDENRHFDTGLKLGAGFEYQSFYFGVGEELGFVNTLRHDGRVQRNHTFMLNVGYNF